MLTYNCIKKSDFEKFTSVLTNFVWEKINFQISNRKNKVDKKISDVDKKISDVDKKSSDVDKKSSDVLALDLYTSLW